MGRLIGILGSGNPMLAKDDVLLEDNHPAVVRHIKHMTATRSIRPEPRDAWVDKHISKHGLLHWLDNAASAADDDILALSFPGIRTLTTRERDACIIHGIPLPDPERRIVNLLPCGRNYVMTGKYHCNHLPPCWKFSRFLLADRVRF